MRFAGLLAIGLVACGGVGQTRSDAEPILTGPLPPGWWQGPSQPPVWYAFAPDGLHVARGAAESLGVGIHDLVCDDVNPAGERTCVDRLSEALGQERGIAFRLRGPLGDGSFEIEVDGHRLRKVQDPGEVGLFDWADQRAVRRPGACDELLACMLDARQECLEAVVFGCAQSSSIECGSKAHVTCPSIPEWHMVREATQPACQAAFQRVRSFLEVRMASVPGSCQVR